MRRGALQAGEKVQFCDRKGKKITEQLVPGGVTQTEHGLIVHDDVIGRTEGVVVTTVTAKRERTAARRSCIRRTSRRSSNSAISAKGIVCWNPARGPEP